MKKIKNMTYNIKNNIVIQFICGVYTGWYACSVFKVNKTKKRLTFIQKVAEQKVVFKYKFKK